MATDNPDTPKSGASSTPRRVTRRDFARYGAVAGAVVWTAPRITTINFAQKIVGSPGVGPRGSTTTTSTSTPDTEPSSTSTSSSTTSTTVHTQGSSVSTSTSTTSSTVHAEGSTTSTTECKPGNGFGDKNHCHSGPPGQINTEGGKATNDPSSGSGPLAFTGADTLELVGIAAVAVVGGRALYSLSKRRNGEEAGASSAPDDSPRSDI